MNRGGALAATLLALVAAVAAGPAVPGTIAPVTPEIGGQGVAGGQCPLFVVFTAPDGCSTCSCSPGSRMTDCDRSSCPDPGNYTINECVEGALYAGSDGCNSCQCNAWRRFSWCTRKICLQAHAPPAPPVVSEPPRRPLRPILPTQRPPLAPFPTPPRNPAPRPSSPTNHAVAPRRGSRRPPSVPAGGDDQVTES